MNNLSICFPLVGAPSTLSNFTVFLLSDYENIKELLHLSTAKIHEEEQEEEKRKIDVRYGVPTTEVNHEERMYRAIS